MNEPKNLIDWLVMNEITLEEQIDNLQKYVDILCAENLLLSEKLTNSYVTPSDFGPWRVQEDCGRVVIYPDVFDTDVGLSVSGDFYTTTHKVNYAKDVAHRLSKQEI